MIINERRDAPLYHGTSISNAFKILQTNKLKPGRNYAAGSAVCFTRSKKFASTVGDVIFVLDQAKLMDKYKLNPVSDYKNFLNQKSRYTTQMSKAEEVCLTDINNIKSYIKDIEISKSVKNRDYVYNELMKELRTRTYTKAFIKAVPDLRDIAIEVITRDLKKLGQSNVKISKSPNRQYDYMLRGNNIPDKVRQSIELSGVVANSKWIE